MSGFNIFDKFDFITWVSQDFLEHYGLFTYEDALTQFKNLHSVEASFAICWQQLDSLFFCMDEDQLRTIREEVLRDLESSNSWKMAISLISFGLKLSGSCGIKLNSRRTNMATLIGAVIIIK